MHFIDADGRALDTAPLDPLRADQAFTIEFDRWASYRRAHPTTRERRWLGRYSQLGIQVQRVAEHHGIDLRAVVDQVVGSVAELDRLTSAVEAAIEHKPGGLRRLLRLVGGANAHPPDKN